MTENHGHKPSIHGDAGYEKKDISANKVIFVGVMGILFLVVIIIALMDYFTVTKEEQIYESVLRPESTVLRELRAREMEVLNSYKLLDAQKGVYQIPISRAIELMADSAYQAELKKVQEKTGL